MTDEQGDDSHPSDKDERDIQEKTIDPISGVDVVMDWPEQRQFKPSSTIYKTFGTVAGPLLRKYTDPPRLEWDRPRGVLSKTDRKFLLGEKKYAHKQSRSNRKQTIRERVEHSLYDFTFLWMMLPPAERERVFDAMADTDAAASVESLITFAYLSIGQDVTELERRIENGVLAGAGYDPESKEDGEVTNVDVSIDVNYKPRVTELKTKLEERADELTPEEIGILVREGELDSEDLTALEKARGESSILDSVLREIGENDSSE